MSAEGSPAPTEPEPEAGHELRQAVASLLGNCELSDVRPERMVAEFEAGGDRADEVRALAVDVSNSNAWRTGFISNRFAFVVRALTTDDRGVARFEFDLVVDYAVNPTFEPDQSAVEVFAATTAYFAAYPYARELLQTLSDRLRLGPLVLSFLRRGAIGSEQVLLGHSRIVRGDGTPD